MKRLLLSLLVVFSIHGAHAQDDKDSISSDFSKFWGLMQQGDMEGVIDYMYPRFFELASRNELVKVMGSLFQDSTIRVGFSDLNIIKVSNVLEVDGVKYSLIDYDFVMELTVLNVEGEDMLDDKLVEFEEKYGAKNLRLERESNTCFVKTRAKSYAISSPTYDTWKFLKKKPQYAFILKDWFPKKVLKKLK